MTDIEILESTYLDKATISRRTKVVNEETGVTEWVNVVIAKNVKCALSKKDEPILNGEVGSVVSTHKLFINPNADIVLGDEIEVINGINSKSSYIANDTFWYSSHIEVLITKKVRS